MIQNETLYFAVEKTNIILHLLDDKILKFLKIPVTTIL